LEGTQMRLSISCTQDGEEYAEKLGMDLKKQYTGSKRWKK